MEKRKPRIIRANVSLLAIALILLKVTETISWPWWLVLMPLWIGPAIIFSLVMFMAFVAFMAAILRALE